MIVGDFGEDYEIMVPFQALRAVGHEVHAVRPEKEADDGIKTAIHDFRGDQTYLETRGHDFALTHGFDDVDLADYDALVVPGGRAPEYLRGHDVVLDAVRHFFAADNPVASICHGPQILAAADVLDGVTTDGNLVTGQAWPDHPEWIAQFLELLGTEIDHGAPAVTAD